MEYPEVALPEAGTDRSAIAFVLSIDGARLVCAIEEGSREAADGLALGSLMAVETPEGRAIAVLHAMRSGRRSGDAGVLELQLLGELRDSGNGLVFRRGITRYPLLHAPAWPASPEEEATVYAVGDRAAIQIGHIRHSPTVPASVLVDELLGKHFAVLGSTGCGKSSSVAVLINSIIDRYPHAHILIIDPHGEYAAAFGERMLRLDAATLDLPYWLLTFEELAAVLAPGDAERTYAERSILRNLLLRVRRRAAGEAGSDLISMDMPIPYRLSDLEALIEEGMGTLDKPEGTAPYRQLLARIANARVDPRYAFLFPKLAVRDNLEAILARLFRIPGDGRPVTVLDTSGMASEIVDVVVSVLCRVVFEYGLWSERGRVRPVLLVCEEAHRYVPSDPELGFAPSRRAIDRLAKEGRKYGVSLCLVSQRPGELSSSALSQCGTVFALRMSNERDQNYVEKVLPDGSSWMLRALPALGTGEALVIGEGVPVPMTVRFRQLPPERRPASDTPCFSRIWEVPPEKNDALAATIERWRRQQR